MDQEFQSVNTHLRILYAFLALPPPPLPFFLLDDFYIALPK